MSSAAVGASGALSAPALAAERRGESHDQRRDRVPPDKISVQLYTLRDQLVIDLDGTLAALRGIGYTRVEHAGFVGRTVEAFKAALNAHGLWASSGHVGIPQPFDLNRAGEMARQAGLRLGYHNHNWEFFRLLDDPSRNAYDVLTDETDRDLVHLEIDISWAWRGAVDPVDLIKANRRRVLQFHVKDLDQAGSFADPGDGLIDFARVFEAGKRQGVVEFIVERDDAGTPPRAPEDAVSTAEVGYEFLRNIRF